MSDAGERQQDAGVLPETTGGTQEAGLDGPPWPDPAEEPFRGSQAHWLVQLGQGPRVARLSSSSPGTALRLSTPFSLQSASVRGDPCQASSGQASLSERASPQSPHSLPTLPRAQASCLAPAAVPQPPAALPVCFSPEPAYSSAGPECCQAAARPRCAPGVMASGGGPGRASAAAAPCGPPGSGGRGGRSSR